MNDTLKYLLPFSYFLKSRLTSKKDLVFHLWYEWIIAFLLLAFNYQWDLGLTTRNFLLGYLAFISIYELGYFSNDIYATRFEAKPRKRINNFNPSTATIAIWVGLRLLVFAGVTYYLGVESNIIWWTFYGCLCVVYIMHNVLKNEQLKTVTFFQLAFFRFTAPLFIFVSSNLWSIILVPILVNYVFYRTLTYMESKGLTNIPDRILVSFKVKYYLFFLTIGVFMSAVLHSFVPLAIHFYYLFFWVVLFYSTDQKAKID